jgi:hypothetical protein
MSRLVEVGRDGQVSRNQDRLATQRHGASVPGARKTADSHYWVSHGREKIAELAPDSKLLRSIPVGFSHEAIKRRIIIFLLLWGPQAGHRT